MESVHSVNMDLLKKAFETSAPELGEQARRGNSTQAISSVDWQVLFPRPKTDQNGEFTMRGLGRNQIATVTLYHEQVDAEKLYLVGIEMEPQQLAMSSRRGVGRKEIYLGTRFTHAAGPAIPVSGVVTEQESGKPVANARVSVERLFRGGDQNSSNQLRFARYIKTVTDDQGRYQLVGIPPGKGHVLEVIPELDEPLFPMLQEFSVDSTSTNATVNLQVLRGLWIEGKVTDAQAGEPIQGGVDYFPFLKNPNVSKMNSFGTVTENAPLCGRLTIRATIVWAGLPRTWRRHVHLETLAETYPRAAGAEKIDGYLENRPGRLQSVMVGMPLSNWNQISFVDPPADATLFEQST